MTAVRQPALIELDQRSSEPQNLYGIITADCSGAHEYDDGLLVRALPEDHELYEVNVFAVDTSALYKDGATMKRVHKLTESRYHNPKTGSESYSPMLDPDLTQSLHFAKGTIRKALVISFIVGAKEPPTTPVISYGRAEVLHNYKYNRFGEKCRYSPNGKAYGRAAAYLLRYLTAEANNEEAVYKELVHVSKYEAWRRGSDINQTYMVAANHLVGRLMRDEDRLAIYRTHDVDTEHLTDVISPRVARYSTGPALHAGLSLNPYCRITSPLRRGEDFVMHGLLQARRTEREMTAYDSWAVNEMIRRLNQRVVADQYYGDTTSPGADDRFLAHINHQAS